MTAATPPVIVIFGGAVRRDGSPSGAMLDRVRTAYRDGEPIGATYMPTGGIGRHGPAEAEVMAGLLRSRGVLPERIRIEPTGRNTIGSVRACARLLRGYKGIVYAASSAYHLTRCVMLLQMAGLQAAACPPTWGPASSNPLKRAYWNMRELPAIPVDAALMLWYRLLRRV